MKTLATLALAAALLGQTHDLQRGAAAPSTALRFDVPADHPERWTVVLSGVDARVLRPDALAVYAVPEKTAATTVASAASTANAGDDVAGLPPMAGRYEVEGVSVRFVPRFPPIAGVTYIARGTALSTPDGAAKASAGTVEARFTLPVASPAAKEPPTRVAAIYPTSDRVPANLLKLYIEFSAPMSDGEAERRIHLVDASGREVQGAFLHVDEELWDASRQRLTVLFDPGRIKRGLRANVEDGAPLVAGQTYRVVVDADWRDGQGQPLVSRVERPLVVVAADRASPDWRRWRVEPPTAMTTMPLVVHFDEPLDRALLDRWLVVTDANGQRIDGAITVGPNESTWSFTPVRPWSGARHHLLVDPRLEDRAANSLRSLFDVDLAAPARDADASSASAAEAITLTFTPILNSTS